MKRVRFSKTQKIKAGSTNLPKELYRIVLYLLIMMIYFTTGITGAILAIIHFILLLKNPNRYGMSILINKVINRRKRN